MSSDRFLPFAEQFCKVNPEFTPDVVAALLKLAHQHNDEHPNGLFKELCASMACSIHDMPPPSVASPIDVVENETEKKEPAATTSAVVVEKKEPTLDVVPKYIRHIKESSTSTVVYDQGSDHSITYYGKYGYNEKSGSYEYSIYDEKDAPIKPRHIQYVYNIIVKTMISTHLKKYFEKCLADGLVSGDGAVHYGLTHEQTSQLLNNAIPIIGAGVISSAAAIARRLWFAGEI